MGCFALDKNLKRCQKEADQTVDGFGFCSKHAEKIKGLKLELNNKNFDKARMLFNDYSEEKQKCQEILEKLEQQKHL